MPEYAQWLLIAAGLPVGCSLLRAHPRRVIVGWNAAGVWVACAGPFLNTNGLRRLTSFAGSTFSIAVPSPVGDPLAGRLRQTSRQGGDVTSWRSSFGAASDR